MVTIAEVLFYAVTVFGAFVYVLIAVVVTLTLYDILRIEMTYDGRQKVWYDPLLALIAGVFWPLALAFEAIRTWLESRRKDKGTKGK